mgnify:CR=1 FL=1
MEKIINVAQYIFNEYKRVTGEVIDEMKLQKLLYFSQREIYKTSMDKNLPRFPLAYSAVSKRTSVSPIPSKRSTPESICPMCCRSKCSPFCLYRMTKLWRGGQ